MNIIIKSIIFFLFIPLFSFGQDQRAYGDFSGHSNKRTEKKILKSARKQYDYGNYKDAIGKYSELVKLDSANPMYNYELAQSLYNNFHQPASIPYFERAIRHTRDTLGEAFYFLAVACHLSGKFEQAQKNYRIYVNLLVSYGTDLTGDEEIDVIEDVKHRIEMCENGKKLYQSPTDVFVLKGKSRPFEIVDAGKHINSEFDDYDAVLSANDSVMYFTSRGDSTTGGKVDWDDKYFEDIRVSGLGKNGWGKSFGIGAPINTEKHEAIISISADGKTIYFYRGIKQGTFYFSNLIGGAWTEPEILYEKSDMNTKAWETSFFGFTIAGSDLYVVSDREGGTGGRDIFISHKQADGAWSPLENLGAPVNTKYDEDSPFISADGKTMYFSSMGHNSMGGFDIFRSEKVDGKWTEPVNLGVPFNTPGDDIYFILANNTDRAYYSSSAQTKDGTRDMDVYMINICDEVPSATISGLAKGITDGTMIVTDKETGKEAGRFDIKGGAYSIKVPSGKNYAFTLKTSSIEPASTDIYIPKQCQAYEMYQELVFTLAGQPVVFKNAFFDIKKEAGTTSYSEYIAKADKNNLFGYSELTLTTNPVMVVSVDTVKTVTGTDTTTAIKTTISFNNVLFDFGKSNLSKSFLPELDKAVSLLKKEYPNMKFEVAGHTDSKGDDGYNMKLSKRRAHAVANYLASKGIKKSRMQVVGYGESKPIASNESGAGVDDPEGRSKNRRTEIVIIQ